MTPPITLSIDLEDHRPSPAWEPRYEIFARRWLDFLDERGIRATFFVVGTVARLSPELVVEVAKRGHELGLHNFAHWHLHLCTPAVLRDRLAAAKAHLEDLTGVEVNGFRAPTGTLVPQTYWATEVLVELGFTYSASVLPQKTYVVGFPGCPSVPFRWPSGLIEAPCPGIGVGPVGLPIMGGTFLRVLPSPLVRLGARRLDDNSVPWIYAHPYDIDPLEPFWFVDDLPKWGSPLLWTNRGRMLAKVDRLIEGGARAGAPIGERLAALTEAGAIHTWAPAADKVVTLAERGDGLGLPARR